MGLTRQSVNCISFCNGKLLTNIRLCTATSGAYQWRMPDLKPRWQGLQSWYHIVQSSVVCQHPAFGQGALQVLCNHGHYTCMCMHRSNGSIIKFREYKSGLYYHDTAASNLKPSSEWVNGYSFIVTIAGNKDHFHHCEIEVADWEHTLYAMIGRLSQQQFNHILNNDLITNCLVTVEWCEAGTHNLWTRHTYHQRQECQRQHCAHAYTDPTMYFPQS